MTAGIADFTPATGFIGGGLIGLSAATLLVLSGDVLGASGLVSSVILHPKRSLADPTVAWKALFLSVFLLFSNLVLARYFAIDQRLGQDPSIPVVSTYGYLLGGLFVGFGTRLGNGCTTGHGICGMARLSPRSITAVCTFMLSAFATASVVAPDNKLFANGTAWLRTDTVPVLYNQWRGFGASMVVVLPTLYILYNVWRVTRSDDNAFDNELPPPESKSEQIETAELSPQASEYGAMEEDVEANATESHSHESSTTNDASSASEPAPQDVLTDEEAKRDSVRKLFPSVLASCLFAVGLAVSEMVLPSKVLGFLNLFTIAKGTYDPTLLTVMIGGCIVSMVSYQFVGRFTLVPKSWTLMPRLEKPLMTSRFSIPTQCIMDAPLVGGAFCFGVGWALAGLCPGPAIFLFASGAKPVVRYWWPAFLVGSLLAGCIQARNAKKQQPCQRENTCSDN